MAPYEEISWLPSQEIGWLPTVKFCTCPPEHTPGICPTMMFSTGLEEARFMLPHRQARPGRVEEVQENDVPHDMRGLE